MAGSSRRRRRLLAPLAGALCAGLVLTGCDFDGAYDLPLPGSPVDEDEAYEVTADFDDILNVVPRSPVMVDDVTVGEVVEVDRVGWRARIKVRIRDNVELPDNAVALIRQVSLLGEKYVAIEPPTGAQPTGRLSDGDHIPLSRTGRNPEVEEVLGALSFLLRGGGVGQIKIIADELNQVMNGRQERLRNLLGELDAMVGTLDTQKRDIIRALESIDNLTRTLNAERATITEALDTLGPAIDVLRDQHGQLMSMLRQLDRLGVVGTRVIGATKDDLLANLRHLRPILRELNNAGQSLPRGLSLMISFPFPAEASNVVMGDYANTSIAMDVDFANLFAFYGLPDDPIPLAELPGLPELPKLPELPGRGPRLPETPKPPDVPRLPGSDQPAPTLPGIPGLTTGTSYSSGGTGSVTRAGGFLGGGL